MNSFPPLYQTIFTFSSLVHCHYGSGCGNWLPYFLIILNLVAQQRYNQSSPISKFKLCMGTTTKLLRYLHLPAKPPANPPAQPTKPPAQPTKPLPNQPHHLPTAQPPTKLPAQPNLLLPNLENHLTNYLMRRLGTRFCSQI
jgi:hypothetical protein